MQYIVQLGNLVVQQMDKDIFLFTPNFLRVSFPFPPQIVEENEKLKTMYYGNKSSIVKQAIDSGDRQWR